MKQNSVNITQTVLLASRHYQSGNFQLAAHTCRTILSVAPKNALANNLLGVITCQAGNVERGIEFIRKAVKYKPDFAEAHNNLGNAFMLQKNTAKALTCFRKALSLKPDYVEARINLGNALSKQGDLPEAIESYRKAIAARPNIAELHNNLGTAFKAQGNYDEAIACFKKAMSLNPKLAGAYNNLGNVFLTKGLNNEAVACIQKAISLEPGYSEAYSNLGLTFASKGYLEEAIGCYKKALAIKPDFAKAFANLGAALGDQGKLEDSTACFRKAISLRPDYCGANSNYLFGLNYLPNISQKEIYEESVRWDIRHAKPLLPQSSSYKNSKKPNRRLRIGYVSGDFRKHSVAYFFKPLLRSHDRKKVEVFCYSNVLMPNEVTERLKSNADHWSSILGTNDKKAAKLIMDDCIDILVDLSGHTGDNRLLVFAYKPAPVQVTWLGYPNTTGMRSIDYRLTDDIADPAGEADKFSSEKLIRLPNGFLCYQPDQDTPEVSPVPGLEKGHITFGSFNNITKTTTDVVKLWAKILNRVQDAHLVLKGKQFADKSTQERYLNLFAADGISPGRVKLLPKLLKTEDHLNLYRKIDIGLDPFPYNGTTTTCEALWMGVPVVTLQGKRHSGRVGASIMHRVGLQELLVADSEKEYIEKATALAKDIKRLAELRISMRKRMLDSPLCDAKAFAQNVEEAYRAMWEKYLSARE